MSDPAKVRKHAERVRELVASLVQVPPFRQGSLPPVQTPDWQVSVEVQALPSSQLVPLACAAY